ncbi:8050_t:CDS:1, partial [Paraglomus occultum]
PHSTWVQNQITEQLFSPTPNTNTKDNQLGKSIQPSSSNPLSTKSYKTS